MQKKRKIEIKENTSYHHVIQPARSTEYRRMLKLGSNQHLPQIGYPGTRTILIDGIHNQAHKQMHSLLRPSILVLLLAQHRSSSSLLLEHFHQAKCRARLHDGLGRHSALSSVVITDPSRRRNGKSRNNRLRQSRR